MRTTCIFLFLICLTCLHANGQKSLALQKRNGKKIIPVKTDRPIDIKTTKGIYYTGHIMECSDSTFIIKTSLRIDCKMKCKNTPLDSVIFKDTNMSFAFKDITRVYVPKFKHRPFFVDPLGYIGVIGALTIAASPLFLQNGLGVTMLLTGGGMVSVAAVGLLIAKKRVYNLEHKWKLVYHG